MWFAWKGNTDDSASMCLWGAAPFLLITKPKYLGSQERIYILEKGAGITKSDAIKGVTAMCRVILMMLLAALSSSAMAEWDMVFKNTTSTFYADSESIRKDGDIASMWVMTDLALKEQVNDKPYMSLKGKKEYNCKEEQSRMVNGSFHSGNMGSGEVVWNALNPLISLNHSDWKPIPPDDYFERTLLQTACNSVMAEWVKVFSDSKATSYADPASIRKDGNRLSIRILADLQEPAKFNEFDNTSYLSIKMQYKFDCKGGMFINHSSDFYSKEMGGGVWRGGASNTPTVWQSLPPDGRINNLFKFACKM